MSAAGRLLFIINYSSEPGGTGVPPCPSCLPSGQGWNSSNTFFLGNNSDGALSETGELLAFRVAAPASAAFPIEAC